MTLDEYQATFGKALSETVKGNATRLLAPQVRELLPQHVVLAISEEDATAMLATSGIGRVPQPHGTQTDDNEHVELVTHVEEPNVSAARVLSSLGQLLHLHEPNESAWKAFDTIRLFEPIAGFQYFVLRPGGHIHVGELRVTLLAVVPLSEGEYREATDGHAYEWLERRMGQAGSRREFNTRWSSWSAPK